MRVRSLAATAAAVALAAGAMPAQAQDAIQQVAATGGPGAAAPATLYLEDSASPFLSAKTPAVTNEDAAKVKMPELAFTASAEDAGNFDKYYFFHRPGTDFATAYTDVQECDGYARGLQSGIGYVQPSVYPFTGVLPSAIGGALGNALAAAIFGSGEKRRMRRVNMRTCMHYKGYDRYGLTKKLWSEFNFEEGLSGIKEADRLVYLKQQALVASSAAPQGKALGL
jgi:hypothetical protein